MVKQPPISFFINKFVRGYFGKLTVVMFIAVCRTLIQVIVLPDLLGRSLAIIQTNGLETLSGILWLIFVFSVTLGILELLKRLFICYIKQELDCFLQENFIIQLWQDKKYYEKDKQELSVLFRDTFPALSNHWVDYVTGIVSTVIVIIVGSVYSVRLSPILYGICIVLTMLIFFALRKRKSRVEEERETFNHIVNEENKKSWELVCNHEIERFLNPDKMMKGYRRTANALLNQILNLKKIENAFHIFSLFPAYILMICIAGVGGGLVLARRVEVTVLYQMLFVLPGMALQIFNIFELSSRHSILQGMYKLVNSTFNNLNTPEDLEYPVPDQIHEIYVRSVSFGYSEEVLLFENLSCRFRTGEYWALMGQEGCGKSTFLRLIAGIIPLMEGEIMADNMAISAYSRRLWWENISYLDQIPRYVHGTICENIVMHEKMDKQRLLRAVEEADLTKLINKLECGINSQIDYLSSGEKQKVCLARAFYRNRKILLLDEATSALDTESEKYICNILRKKAEEGWLIIGISHRQQFADFADSIVHFDNYQVTVSGGLKN